MKSTSNTLTTILASSTDYTFGTHMTYGDYSSH